MEPNPSINPSGASQGAAGTRSAGSTSSRAAKPKPVRKAAPQSDKEQEETSSPVSPRDGKSWTEFAGLQRAASQVPQGVRDFCTNSLNQINKMSTTQKVAGAAALAGLGYLAMRASKSTPQ